MSIKHDTMFAVLISDSETDIAKYEKEYGFEDKERKIIFNKIDEMCGIDYIRSYKTIEQVEAEHRG